MDNGIAELSSIRYNGKDEGLPKEDAFMVRPNENAPSVQVSKRLKVIAQKVRSGTVADIGADHALLLITLADSGKLVRGIAGEIHTGPFQNALRRVRQAGRQEQIDVRQGDGLSVLRPGEVDVITIAGMGGALITRILEEGKEKLAGVRQLVLQPNTDGRHVRRWLADNGWTLTEEELVEDGGILYEILVAEPGENPGLYHQPPLTSEQLMILGPWLWKRRHPLLKRRIREILEEKQRIADRLQAAKSEEGLKRRDEVAREIEEWRRIEQWGFKDVN
jgi:tRNA (adenine22-N1)-methyltransferase